MQRFTGKSVLITGASGGFGRDAAIAFAAEGAHVVISDVEETGLEETTAMLPADQVTHMLADVSNPEDHRRLLQLVLESHGRLDIAVNNAGIVHPPMKTEDVPEKVARKIIEVDLLGMFWALQTQIPQMQTQFREGGEGGVIVNIASVAGLIGSPTLSIYAAAKHGVVGLTRTAAMENARRGIRVNAICPGFTRTSMVDETLSMAPDKDAAEADLVRGVPMRRVGERSEIVQAILWAAAPENSFMTGQAVALDGGITGY